jgi:hypothetical protein
LAKVLKCAILIFGELFGVCSKYILLKCALCDFFHANSIFVNIDFVIGVHVFTIHCMQKLLS